ncbi:MAG: hypothetical protein KF706_10800 [Chitinophagales bacterium]|nr:hypothetical protein [Chitinophagales bacterium]
MKQLGLAIMLVFGSSIVFAQKGKKKMLHLLILLLMFTGVAAQGSKAPIVVEIVTNHPSTEAALAAAKTALLNENFISQGGIQNNAFTATKTTGSKADYYVADVTAAGTTGSISLTITFVKVGTGFLKLETVAQKIKAALSGTTVSSAPASGSAQSTSATAATSTTTLNPNLPGLEQTVNWLIKNTVEVTVEGVKYYQQLERETKGENCKLKLTVTKTTDKSEGATEVFTFNLKDLDESTITFSVKGKLLIIGAKTNIKEGSARQKLVHQTKAGQLLNYGDAISIVVDTPEKGNNYADALKHATQHCKQAKKGWADE